MSIDFAVEEGAPRGTPEGTMQIENEEEGRVSKACCPA